MTDERIPAWERSPLEVRITETYEAEVIGEKGENYLVTFADYDGGMVEAKMEKKGFENFPYPIEDLAKRGVYFTIVVYKINGKTKSEAWPIPMHWSPMLRYFNPEFLKRFLESKGLTDFRGQIEPELIKRLSHKMPDNPHEHPEVHELFEKETLDYVKKWQMYNRLFKENYGGRN